MRKVITIFIIFIFEMLSVSGQSGYPIPPVNSKMLFFLQRSHNINTIIYEINTLPDGSVNKEHPINIYWIRYAESGQKADLSFLQKKAFGLQCKLIDEKNNRYVLRFNNFHKRDIYMSLTDTGQYKAYVNINSELAQLSSAFIKADHNAIGIPKSVAYIDFRGISLRDGSIVSEKVKP